MIDELTGDSVRSELASNLRRLRVARHMSLSELARDTAISKATLSGIERGRGNPTVETLAVLAGRLRVSLAELLEASPLGEVRIVRAAQAGIGPADRVSERPFESLRQNGKVEVFELSLPPAHLHEVSAGRDGSRRAVRVLEGRLIAGPVERISELVSGDYASFPADVAQVYETPGGASRALVIAYTPD